MTATATATAKSLLASLALLLALEACSSSSSTPAPVVDGGGSATADAGGDAAPDADQVDARDAVAPGVSCDAATAGLSQTAEPSAPVLDPTSFLQRVDSNDAFCAARTNGQLATFGPYGYQLTIRFTDADGDGPTSLDDIAVPGVVRLASDPNIQIQTRTDQKRWSTGGGIILQLCLDKVYAVNDLAVGFDIADKAGHRSKAICIRQQSGG